MWNSHSHSHYKWQQWTHNKAHLHGRALAAGSVVMGMASALGWYEYQKSSLETSISSDSISETTTEASSLTYKHESLDKIAPTKKIPTIKPPSFYTIAPTSCQNHSSHAPTHSFISNHLLATSAAVATPTASTTTNNSAQSSPTTHTHTSWKFPVTRVRSHLRRHRTIQLLQETAEQREHLEDRYQVQWNEPLGEGTFGVVYWGLENTTDPPQAVAIKKIPKRCTDNATFQREMDALLQLKRAGGHPNICGLHEHYDEGDFYYLVLDLVSGGEMFDHLCANGAYSEAAAARLLRQVASALAFLHGIGIVHGDLKPENLMLSSTISADAVMKVVDFGCAQTDHFSDGGENDMDEDERWMTQRGTANTPAYSPPEGLGNRQRSDRIDPSFDMWALGKFVFACFSIGAQLVYTGVYGF
jgi:predicted Ser/Thr protein kinase